MRVKERLAIRMRSGERNFQNSVRLRKQVVVETVRLWNGGERCRTAKEGVAEDRSWTPNGIYLLLPDVQAIIYVCQETGTRLLYPQKRSNISGYAVAQEIAPFPSLVCFAGDPVSSLSTRHDQGQSCDFKLSPVHGGQVKLALMKKAFNLACREWEWTKDNPVCRVSMERENNTRDRWLTREEEARLLAAAAPWLQDVIVFAIHTGMRCGEILNLTWAGVDLHRRTATVFKSKNGERRTIPLSHTLVQALQARGRRIDSELVFTSAAGTPLDAPNLRRSFRLALKHGQVSDFRFHDLRHTCATRMVQAGVDLYKVQRILGHKSPMMTQRYAHHYPESLRDGVAIFDAGRTFSTNLAQAAIRPEQVSLTC